jgi:S1-C subfamily serine protease
MLKKLLLLLVVVLAVVLASFVRARKLGGPAELQVVQAQSSVGLIGFSGYIVEDVAADSPAAEAGIRQNDIVTYIDNRPVRSLDTIKDTFGLTPPGKLRSSKCCATTPRQSATTSTCSI